MSLRGESVRARNPSADRTEGHIRTPLSAQTLGSDLRDDLHADARSLPRRHAGCLTSKELGHMSMCRMTLVSGNLQRAGVTGHTLTRTVSDLLRSRRPFAYWDGEGRRYATGSAWWARVAG